MCASLQEQGTKLLPCPTDGCAPSPAAVQVHWLHAHQGSWRRPQGRGETQVCGRPTLPDFCLYFTSCTTAVWVQGPPLKLDAAAALQLRRGTGSCLAPAWAAGNQPFVLAGKVPLTILAAKPQRVPCKFAYSAFFLPCFPIYSSSFYSKSH